MNSLFFVLFEQIVNETKDKPKFSCHIAIIMVITLTACASTSAFQTGSQNMTRDAEIKFLFGYISDRRRDATRVMGAREYSQTARAMFQFHKEYPIFVRCLKCCDILLADVHWRGSCVLQEPYTRDGQGICNVSQRQGHAGEY